MIVVTLLNRKPVSRQLRFAGVEFSTYYAASFPRSVVSCAGFIIRLLESCVTSGWGWWRKNKLAVVGGGSAELESS